ncbi:type II toxin-antitoxin system RelE/ParE family toxin [Parabacteroides johnsonii]|uniref:type II toxin-antitoxin system RelE/ParE family toxin n=1 Tax=Parabacteroides johnsonii TaxID=387661 RepID=UPI004027D02B
MPQIGAVEPLLATKSREYRYIISSHYKIIYYIQNTTIVIACIFDCRQDPDKLKNL